MSTNLKTLKGKTENPDTTQKIPTYKDTEVHLTRFFGGVERGTSLQLGFYDADKNYHHVQLDNENVKELIKELQDYFL